MPTDAQRIQKRTPATVALQVFKCDAPFHHGIAFTENVSFTRRPGCNGACVETRRARDCEVLPRQHPITGKVIYCHHLAKKRYAVGLSYIQRLDLVDTSQPARAEV